MSAIFIKSFFINLLNLLINMFLGDLNKNNNPQNEDIDNEKFNPLERFVNWDRRKH